MGWYHVDQKAAKANSVNSEKDAVSMYTVEWAHSQEVELIKTKHGSSVFRNR